MSRYVSARERGMDTALQADLGGAELNGLGHAPLDLRHVERIAGPAQRVRAAALGERAEPARVAADVRVVDVAVDDIGDCAADRRRAQFIRSAHDGREVLALGAEQCRDLALVEARPCKRAR